jgi:hypothetical protein
MRFLTPLLAGAALLTLAAPLAASAQPFHDGGERGDHQQGGFDHRDGRGYGDRGRGERGFGRSYGYGFGIPYVYGAPYAYDDGAYPAYGYADYGYGYRFHHHWGQGHRGFHRGW